MGPSKIKVVSRDFNRHPSCLAPPHLDDFTKFIEMVRSILGDKEGSYKKGF